MGLHLTIRVPPNYQGLPQVLKIHPILCVYSKLCIWVIFLYHNHDHSVDTGGKLTSVLLRVDWAVLT